MGTLIRNARIITQDDERRILQADILINKHRIERVGTGIPKEGADEVIDASGKIAFPGLINAHTHISMSLFRGYGEGFPLKRWLEEKIWPAEEKLKEEDIYWGTLLGAIEMIRSGTTCFSDMYMLGLSRMADAAGEIGIRAVISQGLFDASEHRTPEAEMAKMEKVANELAKTNPRIKAGVGAHAVYSCSEDLLRLAKEFASYRGLPFHIHVGETREEVFSCLGSRKLRPVEYLESIGAADSGSIFAHMGWVTKREIAIAGKCGVNVVHCPISNLKLATGGICPAAEFIEAGANVALGTDGPASNNSQDMIETMKSALLLQSHKYWDAQKLSPAQIWDCATINGARALGFDTGSIEEGKLADIVLIDAKAANLLPLHNDLRSIAYSLNPSNITDVMINGKFVLRNGKITLVDEELVLEKAADVAHEVVSR
jgi:5-methylthioadenosine/S-adenosylhomocysteine deaminase